MMLTTKTRYAVVALIEVACRASNLPVRLEDVSKSQNIPIDYLEQIFSKLKRAQLVKAVKGPGGGYILTDRDISISKVMQIVEEDVKITGCGTHGYCTGSDRKCVAHDFWHTLEKEIETYLNARTIGDFLKS